MFELWVIVIFGILGMALVIVVGGLLLGKLRRKPQTTIRGSLRDLRERANKNRE